MNDLNSILRQMNIRRVDHLPIVAQFCRRICLIDTVNRAVPSDMAVDIGTVVQAMVIDTLSGRSPLYMLEEFIRNQDTGVLLGCEVSPGSFNDTTIGRAMDAIYSACTEKVFSQVAFRAASEFVGELDMRHVHFDTTSISVWGDKYSAGEDGLQVTYGHSKDKRPDLKQFMLRMLCVHRNIPLLGGCEDGNASDVRVNNRELTRLSGYMATHGLSPRAFVYVADSAMVNRDNLEVIGDSNLFITRLPFRYGESERLVEQAVCADAWTEVPREAGRPSTRYRVWESAVELYGKAYRAVVVHSDAHDKRRLHRLDRRLKESLEKASDSLRKAVSVEYFCPEDAEAAMGRLLGERSGYHSYVLRLREQVTYARGRPSKEGRRRVSSVRYMIEGEIVELVDEVEKIRQEAGCFVLLTNTPAEGEMGHSPVEVLAFYKEQHGIERNFGFLKDPLVMNGIFLKSPERIEVLGMILLISLLVWNLMEHVMRLHLKQAGAVIPGWDAKPTSMPTSFMMSTKFRGIQIVECMGERCFAAPLTPVQERYLKVLGLDADSLLCYSNHKGKNEEL